MTRGWLTTGGVAAGNEGGDTPTADVTPAEAGTDDAWAGGGGYSGSGVLPGSDNIRWSNASNSSSCCRVGLVVGVDMETPP